MDGFGTSGGIKTLRMINELDTKCIKKIIIQNDNKKFNDYMDFQFEINKLGELKNKIEGLK